MNNSLPNQKQSIKNQNVKSDDSLDKILGPKKFSGYKISIVVLIFLIFIVAAQAVEVNYIKHYAKGQNISGKNTGVPASQGAQPKTGLPSQVGGC
jgi:hypothetical protein